MSTSATPSTSTSPCGACKTDNPSGAQFCSGCGHALFEPCGGCGAQVGLTQKFCVACGKDLAALLDQRRKHSESRMAEAVAAAKMHHYTKSLSILESLSQQSDFRFTDLARRADEALKKVTALKERVVTDAEQRQKQAAAAFAAEQFSKVVELLSSIPPSLLEDEAGNHLMTARQHLDQTGALQSELQTALAQKNYGVAAGLLQQLLGLMPEHKKYLELATQLGTKLISRARKKFARQDYAGASETLHSIPEQGRSEAYHQLIQQIETTRWLSDQFNEEPFASAVLGRLAIRFSREVPQDGFAAGLVKEMSVAVKGKRTSPRDGLAPWKGIAKSWLGPRFGMLAHPQSIDTTQMENRPATFSEYAAAIGLALQGLGLSRVQQQLIPKKGLFAGFGKGKSKRVWGIDVGSFAIHAIELRIDKPTERPVVVAAVTVPLKNPTCRGGGLRANQEDLQETIAKLLEKIDVDGASVWSNLPSSDSVSRFVELPPVKDKEADRLIDLEAKHRIPIPPEDLSLISWRAPMHKKEPRGRPVVMTAATKVAVTRRIDWLGASGLKVDGLVPDGIALANFAAFEFSDLLGVDAAEEAAAEDSDSDIEANAVVSTDDAMPSVVLVDAGAAKTMFVVVSPIAIWYWSQESGGEDATSIVARQTKKTSEEADQVKRNLGAVEAPDVVDGLISDRQDALRMRLVKLWEEASRTFRHFRVDQVWCVGGAQLQHGFHRRVLGQRRKSSS